jgi:hypothetical protein
MPKARKINIKQYALKLWICVHKTIKKSFLSIEGKKIKFDT